MAEKPYHPIPEPIPAVWRTPQCPFRVEYDPQVLEDIRRLAVNAFHSLPHGGAEIGGVLFGAYENGELRIQGSQPTECQYAFGPSFVLSEKDMDALDALLESSRAAPEWQGMVPVGWYHSHTRSDLFLSEKDLEIHERFFPEPWQVALVIRPNMLEPSRAGFFFREADGRIRSESPYQELVLPAPRRKPARRAEPQVTEAAESESVEAVALPAPPSPPVPARAMDLPPAVTHHAPRPYEPPSQSHLFPWAIAVAATLVAVIMGLAGTKRGSEKPAPPPVKTGSSIPVAPAAIPLPPALHLTAGELDGQFQIRWDRAASPVRTARLGRLEIEDGSSKTAESLSPGRLLNGTFGYGRQSEHVEAHLILVQPDGTQQEESTSYFSGKIAEPKPTAAPGRLQRQIDQLKADLQSERKRANDLRREILIQRDLLRKR